MLPGDEHIHPLGERGHNEKRHSPELPIRRVPRSICKVFFFDAINLKCSSASPVGGGWGTWWKSGWTLGGKVVFSSEGQRTGASNEERLHV